MNLNATYSPEVLSLIFSWADRPDAASDLKEIFGGTPEICPSLLHRIRNKDLSWLPRIEILPTEILSPAIAAYARATATIYLSDACPSDLQTEALLEEIGHHIDALLNTEETTGDEGALFSATVRGVELTEEEITSILNEDDSALIVHQGSLVSVECIIPRGPTLPPAPPAPPANDSIISSTSVDMGTTYPNAHTLILQGNGLNGKGNAQATNILQSKSTAASSTGNTLIAGTGAATTMIGGASNDSLYALGYAGTLSMIGGAGNSTMVAGSGAATLRGGSGNNSLKAGTGNQSLIGGGGANILIGGTGKDTLRSGSGTNSLHSGSVANGSNTLIGGGTSSTLRAGSGNDSLYASSGNSTLLGGTGKDTLVGGTGVNSLVSGSTSTGAGGNTLIAGRGSNTLVAGAGTADSLVGTTGSSMAGTSNTFVFNSTVAISSTHLVADTNPTAHNIQNSIVLGTGLDTETVLDPQPANWQGNFGTLSISTLVGAKGVKVQLGQNAEVAGIRTLIGGSGNDTFDLTGGNSTANAASGSSTIVVTNASKFVVGQMISGKGIPTGTKITNITGTTLTLSSKTTQPLLATPVTTGYDALGGSYINAFSNVAGGTTSILGGAGNDTIIGSAQGGDSINGGSGNDLFLFNKTNLSANSLDGGDGSSDTLSIGLNSQTLSAVGFANVKGIEVLSLAGGSNSVSSLQGSGIQTMIGGTGNDTIIANVAVSTSQVITSGSILSLTSLAGLKLGQQLNGVGIQQGTKISGISLDTAFTAGLLGGSKGSTSLAVTGTSGLIKGQFVYGTGIAAGTTITFVDTVNKKLTLSSPLTSTIASGSSLTANSNTITISSPVSRQIAANSPITAAIDGAYIDGSNGFTQNSAANPFNLRSTANIGATTLQVDTSSLSNPNSLFAGMVLTGTGIAKGTTITSILYANGLPSSIGISQATTKQIVVGTSLNASYSPTLASGQYLQAMGQGVTVIADSLAGNIAPLYSAYDKGNTLVGSATIVAGAYASNTLVGGAYNTTFLINNQTAVGSQSDALGSISAGQHIDLLGQQQYGVNTLLMANPGATLDDRAFSQVSSGALQVLSVSTGSNSIVLGQNAATAGLATLLGGTGSDTLDAMAFNGGNPLFINDSKALNSSLLGGAGNDVILGGTGNVIINGGGGNDSLIGGVGWNTIIAGSGDSTLDGGAGRTTLQGSGDSSNLYIVRQSSTRITASGSNDNVDSYVNFDPIQLATPAVTAIGTNGSYTITVNSVAGLSVGLQIGNVSNQGTAQSITQGTVITAINAATKTLTLSTKLTAALTGAVLFTSPNGDTLALTATNGSIGLSTMTLLSTYGLSVGMALNSPGIIASGTTITAISGTSVTLSSALIGSVVANTIITANYTAPVSFSDASPSTTKTQSFASSDISGFYNLKNFSLESAVATGVGNAQANLITSTGTLSHLIMGMGGDNTLVGNGTHDSLYGYVSPDYGTPNLTAPIAIDSRDQAFFDSVVGVSGNNSIVANGAYSYLDGGPGYNDGQGNATGHNILIGTASNDTFVVHNSNDSVVAAQGFNSLVSSTDLHNIADNITDARLLVTNQSPSNLPLITPNLPAAINGSSNTGQTNPSSYLGFGNGSSNSTSTQIITFAGFGSISLASAASVDVSYGTSSGVAITPNISVGTKSAPTSLSWTAPTARGSLGVVQSYNVYFQIQYTDDQGASQTSPWLSYLVQTPLPGSNNPPTSLTLNNLQKTYTDSTTGKTYKADSYNFEVIPQQNTIPVDFLNNPIAITLQGSNGNDVISGEYVVLESLQSGQQYGAVGTSALPLGEIKTFTTYLSSQNGNDLLIAPILGDGTVGFGTGNPWTAGNGVVFSGINTMVGGVGSDTFFVANGRVDTSKDVNTKLPTNTYFADLTVKNAGTTPINYTNAAPNTGKFTLASGSLDTSGVSLNGGQHNLVISVNPAFKLSSTDPSAGQFIDELYVYRGSGMGNALDNFVYSSRDNVTLAGDTGRDSLLGGGKSALLIGGTQFGYDILGNPIGLDNVGLALGDLYGTPTGYDAAGNANYSNVYSGVPYSLPAAPYTSFYQDTDPVPMGTSGAQAQNPAQFWTLSGPNGPVLDQARNSDTLIAANETLASAVSPVSTYLAAAALSGTHTITVKSTRGFVVGQRIAGAGIKPGSIIGQINNNVVTLIDGSGNASNLISKISAPTTAGIVNNLNNTNTGVTPIYTGFGTTALHAATIAVSSSAGDNTLTVSWSSNSSGPSKGDLVIGVNGIPDGTTITEIPTITTIGATSYATITLSKNLIVDISSNTSLFSYVPSPVDTLDGGAGGDSMVGGLSNDMFYVSTYGSSITPLTLSGGIDSIKGDSIIGNGGNDTVVWTASDGVWPGYNNKPQATNSSYPSPGIYSLDSLSNQGATLGGASISNIILGPGSTLAGGATGNTWSTGNDHTLFGAVSGQGELGSNLIVGNSFDNTLSGGGVGGSAKVGNTFVNLTGIGFDTLIGGGGNDTFDMTYKNGNTSNNYYVSASTDTIASGLVFGATAGTAANVEVDALTISTDLLTGAAKAATDQDYALIDVSGGTTGQQNANEGILTYSPETGYTIDLANPVSSGLSTIYLIGSAPTGTQYGGVGAYLTSSDPNAPFGTNNMAGGLSGGLTGIKGTDTGATSFGIYSYVQGGTQAPNLIAVVNGTTLGSFLTGVTGGLHGYTISNVGIAGVNDVVDPSTGSAASLVVDGRFGVNHLGGSIETIAHTNNGANGAPFSNINNYSNWYTSTTTQSTVPGAAQYSYGGDITTSALPAASPAPANSDVHNFLGMGAFYELYDPTNSYGQTGGVTNLSSHVNLL